MIPQSLAANGTRELLARRIRVARGQEPGDLLLQGGQVVNVFTERVEPADVVVADGWIAGVGPYGWQARQVIDARGCFILPGLIDAHMHLESTSLLPAELARVVVPHGTSAIVADPHEIGNVLGIPGIRLLIEASRDLPLAVFFMASSCVPATPWEDAGAVLDPQAVRELLAEPRILGLAEMMNYPGVLNGDPDVLAKLADALALGAPLDGHAPRLVGQELVAYVAAGIRSDHESSTVEEGIQKAALGMLVQVREGSSAKNLDTLLPLILDGRLGHWCLATDDVHPDDLVRDGHLDARLRRVVAAGVPAPRAVRHATWVPASHYGLRDRGAVAPGYRADLVVVDDLAGFRAQTVIFGGQIVASAGQYVAQPPPHPVPVENTVRLAPPSESTFDLALRSDECPVLGVIPGQIVTNRLARRVGRTNGRWQFDSQRDVVLLACLERHRRTGKVGLGLAEGLGLKKGAIGSSVAHDSHNLIIAGTNARDMLVCVRALEETGGGFVAAAAGQLLARLPLPIAGLISNAAVGQVCHDLEAVHAAARQLGSPLVSPFGTLSFLALPVIPSLKITAQGLFDVTTQEFVPL